MKTQIINDSTVDRKWLVIDAEDLVLGRLASNVANILRGKNKPEYSPSIDCGDNVIIINASKVTLTGKKAETKTYFSHSTYAGGSKIVTYRQAMEKDGISPVIHAVKGMLPKTKLGRTMFKKLHVYAGAEHPHTAQKPEQVTV
jgi:large subunit ribosomal protein L13